MSEPVQEIKNDSLVLEGFENLLEGEQRPPEAVQKPAHEGVQEAETLAVEIPPDYWTTEEAAKHLGVSQRTIFKRLKDGSLKGVRVKGKFRQEWRIEPLYAPLTVLEVVQEGDGSILNTDDKTLDPQEETPGEAKCVPKQSSGTPSYLTELDRMLAVIQEKDRLLQAATFRNGYLEAQLEHREREIKLLTDNQHKRGRWVRFWSWFTGK